MTKMLPYSLNIRVICHIQLFLYFRVPRSRVPVKNLPSRIPKMSGMPECGNTNPGTPSHPSCFTLMLGSLVNYTNLEKN